MLKTVYASCDVLDRKLVSSTSAKTASSFNGFSFTPKEDFLYVTVRAVSARVNRNYDAFTADELRKSYATFQGKPVFVNHENSDLRRARGVIIASKLHDDNPKDVWVEVLMEMDAVTYPKLCTAIASGEINTVSMGCNIEYSECSVCGKHAYTPSEYCAHIRNKGVKYERKTASGGVEKVLAFEFCYGTHFFEESWVFDPADTSAETQAILHEAKVAHMKISQTEYRRPTPVDTLRKQGVCPDCGNENFNGIECEVCHYTETPDSFKAPDTDKAKKTDLDVDKKEPSSVAKPSKDDKSKDKKDKKGGMTMAKPSIAQLKEARRRYLAQTGEQPEAAPESTQVDTSADARIDLTAPGGGGVPAETTAPEATTDLQSDPTGGTPVTEEVSADTSVESAEEAVPVAPVNEVTLPEATENVSLENTENAPVFPEEKTNYEIPVQDSVTARVALVASLQLANMRIEAGLEPQGTDPVLLADKLSRKHTVGEIQFGISQLKDARKASVNAAATRRLVPQRQAAKRPASFVGRSASVNPSNNDEAIFY